MNVMAVMRMVRKECKKSSIFECVLGKNDVVHVVSRDPNVETQ